MTRKEKLKTITTNITLALTALVDSIESCDDETLEEVDVMLHNMSRPMRDAGLEDLLTACGRCWEADDECICTEDHVRCDGSCERECDDCAEEP